MQVRIRACATQNAGSGEGVTLYDGYVIRVVGKLGAIAVSIGSDFRAPAELGLVVGS